MRQAALVGAVLVTAGCGGGGGGNVRDMEDVPGAVPWTQNPTALDIGEHWNETAAIVAAAGFAQGAANTTGLEAAQGAATEASSESITWLRNVGADRIETVGTRDGITLAHWKGGLRERSTSTSTGVPRRISAARSGPSLNAPRASGRGGSRRTSDPTRPMRGRSSITTRARRAAPRSWRRSGKTRPSTTSSSSCLTRGT